MEKLTYLNYKKLDAGFEDLKQKIYSNFLKFFILFLLCKKVFKKV